jgi:hypothetical protein
VAADSTTATTMEVARLHTEQLQRIRENDPCKTDFDIDGEEDWMQNVADEDLEQLGSDIANNTHLTDVYLYRDALDDHKMSFLFRGLTRSSSIMKMGLYENQFSVAGVRSMMPFLQNANNLTKLDLDDNNLQSEGFNSLFRALGDSTINALHCERCNIESIEIDTKQIPRQLKELHLDGNIINADGCRGLAKLLQGEDATTLTDLYLSNNHVECDGVEILAKALRKNKSLTTLHLFNNKIGDDGIETLVNALHRNSTLRELDLEGNDGISKRGKLSLLKLVIDISSIEATLQSNHTLREIKFANSKVYDTIQRLIDRAVDIAITSYSPEDAGREKVRQIQINGTIRAQLANLQGVTHSVYSEIDSLYMPEVLALINRHHGGKELFSALKSTMTGLLSRIDMKLCIQEEVARREAAITRHEEEAAYHVARIDEHGAKMQELNARLAAMEESDRNMIQDTRAQSSKRRRVDG